jgi:hypothetical protein
LAGRVEGAGECGRWDGGGFEEGGGDFGVEVGGFSVTRLPLSRLYL